MRPVILTDPLLAGYSLNPFVWRTPETRPLAYRGEVVVVGATPSARSWSAPALCVVDTIIWRIYTEAGVSLPGAYE